MFCCSFRDHLAAREVGGQAGGKGGKKGGKRARACQRARLMLGAAQTFFYGLVRPQFYVQWHSLPHFSLPLPSSSLLLLLSPSLPLSGLSADRCVCMAARASAFQPTSAPPPPLAIWTHTLGLQSTGTPVATNAANVSICPSRSCHQCVYLLRLTRHMSKLTRLTTWSRSCHQRVHLLRMCLSCSLSLSLFDTRQLAWPCHVAVPSATRTRCSRAADAACAA